MTSQQDPNPHILYTYVCMCVCVCVCVCVYIYIYIYISLRKERRLRMSENRVLRKIFGPKRDEVTGEWRKLHNEELNDLYSTPNIARVIKSRKMR